MNILIVGNGFDLAHGLPTTYKDFLDFVTTYDNFVKDIEVGIDERDDLKYLQGRSYDFLKYITDIHSNKEAIFVELEKMILDNWWIKYFTHVDTELCLKGKIGWIDFESEISNVVQTVESIQKRIKNDYLVSKERKLTPFEIDILKNFVPRIKILDEIGTVSDKKEEIEKIKKRLINDLNSLARALEIYLSDFVNNLPVKKRLPDIEGLKIDKVLSFNYTNTYERLYGKDNPNIEYDYIHGKADINHDIDSCNLVLGIDEYLDGEERDKNTEFIEFKKYYQRIYKKTGCKYLEWEVNNEKQMRVFSGEADMHWNNVYILGHSLNSTDKDVLKNIINMINTTTIIFHHDQKALGDKIANLVKVIGQDNLISMVHGSEPQIILQQQQKPRVIENQG